MNTISCSCVYLKDRPRFDVGRYFFFIENLFIINVESIQEREKRGQRRPWSKQRQGYLRRQVTTRDSGHEVVGLQDGVLCLDRAHDKTSCLFNFSRLLGTGHGTHFAALNHMQKGLCLVDLPDKAISSIHDTLMLWARDETGYYSNLKSGRVVHPTLPCDAANFRATCKRFHATAHMPCTFKVHNTENHKLIGKKRNGLVYACVHARNDKNWSLTQPFLLLCDPAACLRPPSCSKLRAQLGQNAVKAASGQHTAQHSLTKTCCWGHWAASGCITSCAGFSTACRSVWACGEPWHSHSLRHGFLGARMRCTAKAAGAYLACPRSTKDVR